MSQEPSLEADYVLVGAGAVAMAFADTLLTESDNTVIMIDRRHKPGGHWNDAYPFVRLHGPSVNYGVNSRPLGENRIDQSGLNEGLFELATGSEICTYFDEVMRHQLLPTDRLHYLPMHDYTWNGEAVSLLSGRKVSLVARKRIVDAKVADTQIPSRSPPSFHVGADVNLIPPNDLPKLAAPCSQIVVVGAGKTAIDAITWLLTNGAVADQVTWVRPRDAWLLNRATIQPDFAFFDQTFGALAAGFEAAGVANSVDDIFLRLEQVDAMRRIDIAVMPTMFRCAIVSDQELALVRQVTDVVRRGRVRSIEAGRLVLDGGEVAIAKDAVIVNCSASGIPRKPPRPMFQGGKIEPQYVRTCSPTFSGALVAKVELLDRSDDEKNALCTPVPIPDKPSDWPMMQLSNAMNSTAWQKEESLVQWLINARLDQFTKMAFQAQSRPDSAESRTLERYRNAMRSGGESLARLAAQGA